MPRKHIQMSVNTEESICKECGKTLGENLDTLVVMAPARDQIFEYCNPGCMYTHITRLFSRHALDQKLSKPDLLSKLGCEPIETIDARLYEYAKETGNVTVTNTPGAGQQPRRRYQRRGNS